MNVGQGEVSLGLGCLEHRDAILDQVDVAKTPKRMYRSILPKLKRGERLQSLLPPVLTGDLPQPYDDRGVPMVTKRAKFGISVNIKEARISDDDLTDMLTDIAKAVLRYQVSKKY